MSIDESKVIKSTSQSGGIGRRARLKIVYRKVCGFDSHLWYERAPRRSGLFYFNNELVGASRKAGYRKVCGFDSHLWYESPEKIGAFLFNNELVDASRKAGYRKVCGFDSHLWY
jgi:hypothetical protein